MALFEKPGNKQIIVTLKPDNSFVTSSGPEPSFPPQAAPNYLFLMFVLFAGLFILSASGSPVEQSSAPHDTTPAGYERIVDSSYEPTDEQPAALFRNDFPISSSSENASSHSSAKKEGLIFSGSSELRLKKKAVQKKLQETDLSTNRFIYNAQCDIYAECGHTFKEDPEAYRRYMQYSWYRNLEKADLSYDDLPAAAQANIDLLDQFYN